MTEEDNLEKRIFEEFFPSKGIDPEKEMSFVEYFLSSQVIRDAKDYLTPVSVGLIGLGDRIGSHIWTALQNERGISEIYISSPTSKEKAIAFKRSYLEKDVESRIKVVDYASELEKMHETDIVVVSADANPRDIPAKREQRLSRNIDPLKRIGNALKNYDGRVLVVTNPVDIASYIIASESGINPARVHGFAELDRRRLMDLLTPKFGEVEVYTIGPHNEYVVPVYFKPHGSLESKITFDDIKSHTEVFREIIRQGLIEFPREQIRRKGHTGQETAKYVTRVIQAMRHGDEIICGSTYLKLSEDRLPLHIGFPVQFTKDSVNLRTDKVNLKNDFLTQEFKRGYDYLERIIIDLIDNGTIQQIDYEAPSVRKKEKKEVPISISEKSFDFSIVGTSDKEILAWDPNNPNKPETLHEFNYSLKSGVLRRLENNVLFFGGTGDGKVVSFDFETQKEITYDSSGKNSIRGVEVFYLGNDVYIVGTSRNNGVFIWDVNSSKPITESVPGIESGSYGVAKAPLRGREMAVILGRDVYMIDPSEPKGIVSTYKNQNKNARHYNLGSVAISADELYAGNGVDLFRWSIDEPEAPLSKLESSLVKPGALEIEGTNGLRDIFVASRWNSEILRLDKEDHVIERYEKDSGNTNGTYSLMLFSRYVMAGDQHSQLQPQITVWERGNPSRPSVVLTGAKDTIRSLDYLVKK